mmetsp:Transcript_6311/g.12849  ORF Transcript_6311/g.12849 Transcript_6311/m.12849 type:complete len:206 (-) Transcript_6311:1407-2024(-)
MLGHKFAMTKARPRLLNAVRCKALAWSSVIQPAVASSSGRSTLIGVCECRWPISQSAKAARRSAHPVTQRIARMSLLGHRILPPPLSFGHQLIDGVHPLDPLGAPRVDRDLLGILGQGRVTERVERESLQRPQVEKPRGGGRVKVIRQGLVSEYPGVVRTQHHWHALSKVAARRVNLQVVNVTEDLIRYRVDFEGYVLTFELLAH